MVQRPHGIEGMRRAGCPGLNRRPRLGGRRIGVAHAHANPTPRGVPGQFHGARHLWSERHQPHASLRRLKQPVENLDIRRQHVLHRLDPALLWRKKRPFQVDPYGFRSSLPGFEQFRLRDQPGQALDRAQSRVKRRRYRRCQIAARAARRQKASNRLQSLRRGFHYVVPGRPVDVHIHKRRAPASLGESPAHHPLRLRRGPRLAIDAIRLPSIVISGFSSRFEPSHNHFAVKVVRIAQDYGR